MDFLTELPVLAPNLFTEAHFNATPTQNFLSRFVYNMRFGDLNNGISITEIKRQLRLHFNFILLKTLIVLSFTYEYSCCPSVAHTCSYTTHAEAFLLDFTEKSVGRRHGNTNLYCRVEFFGENMADKQNLRLRKQNLDRTKRVSIS